MKFWNDLQNFGDELGRLSCEAMTIPRRDFYVGSAELCEFELTGEFALVILEDENLKAIQIREISKFADWSTDYTDDTDRSV